jgi:hypothetical protein
LYAFQFKAPRGNSEGNPYRYSLVREQHEALYSLAQVVPNSVFYVFPNYVTTAKLQEEVPKLMTETWLLGVDPMQTAQVFGAKKSKVVSCNGSRATINPEYGMHRAEDVALGTGIARGGVTAPEFARWYSQFQVTAPGVRRSPWPRRGLRIVIVLP